MTVIDIANMRPQQQCLPLFWFFLFILTNIFLNYKAYGCELIIDLTKPCSLTLASTRLPSVP